jgi:muconolactone D-isomerase
MVEEIQEREAERAQELAEQGHLHRLWAMPAEPSQWRTLGLWSADGPAGMQAILESLPLYGWMTTETTPLSPHPSDPALTRR